MDLGLEDKVVVITGGGAGIANAALDGFLAEGASVVTGDLDISAVADRDGVLALEVDLLEATGPARLVEAAIAQHGTVDVLVNAVGGGRVTEGFLATDDESWQWHVDLNLMTAVRMARAVLPIMVDAGRGAIVSVSSEAGREPLTFFSEYSALKAALISFSKCLAREFGPKGIRVNTVCPGMTLTPQVLRGMTDFAAAWGISAEEAIERYTSERGAPLGRINRPDEVAAAILYMASDAASMTTGSELVVDGGARYGQ